MNHQILILFLKLLAHYPQRSQKEQSLLKIIELQNEKIAILKKRLPKRPRLTWPERIRLSNIARSIPIAEYVDLVHHLWKPETVIGWVKRWQRKQIRGEIKSETGRPPLSKEVKQTIVQLYQSGIVTLRRIVGELKKCEITVSKSSVANVLMQHGLIPNGDGDTWRNFLKRHAHLIAATDFFTVPIGLFGKVVNIDVLFAIEHDTRKAHFLGMTPNANATFMKQIARNTTCEDTGCLRDRKFLIHDNDTKFCKGFTDIINDAGLKSKRTAILAPKMNAYAERFVRSIKHECLNKFIFLNEAMLRRAVLQYIEHYNSERPHQGIGNNTIEEWNHHGNSGEIVVDKRLGGVLKSARRLAA